MTSLKYTEHEEDYNENLEDENIEVDDNKNNDIDEIKRINDIEIKNTYYQSKTSPSITDALKLLELYQNFIYENAIPIFDINNYNQKINYFYNFINNNISK